MASFGGRTTGTLGLGHLLIPLLFLGLAESQLLLSVGPSPVRAALGSDVLLPCTFTVRERFEISKFYLAWSREGRRVAEYVKGQQIDRQGSELFPEELSRGNCSLLLSRVTVQDGGRYTSTIIYTPDKEEKQLELQVTAAPRLSIPRRSAAMDTASSFPCHVGGFYPSDIDIAWLRDGQVLTDATRSDPQRNPDGTFNLTLTYTFTPTARDSSSNFSCRISHSALAQPLQEGFTLALGVAPRISVPRRTVIRNMDTYIPCHVWGFYPESVTVTWLRDGRVLSDTICSAPRRNPDGTFNITAIYIFTPTARDSGSVFSCRVSHSALAQPLQEGFILDVTGTGVTVFMIITAVCVTLLLVTVAVLAIYCWRHRRAPKGAYKALGETPAGDPARSREEMRGEDRVVMEQDGVGEAGEGHENQPLLLTDVQEQRVTEEPEDGPRVTGLLRPPELSEICKPESVTEGQETTLSCRVTGHFPGALSGNWLKDSPEYRIDPGAPHTQDGKSFQQETSSSFSPWVRRHQGAEFVCRVGHEALQPPVERGSGELHLADAAGSEVGESQDGGEAVAAAPGTGAPGPNGASSASTEAGPPGPGPAGDGAGDEAAAGLAGKQGGGAAPNVTAGGTGEPAAETGPDTAQEGEAPGETGGSGDYKGVGETPPEEPAGSRDEMRGEDRAVMGQGEAGEGREKQPLLLTDVQEQRVTQEPEDGPRVTGRSDAAGSEVGESQDGGEAVAAAPGTGAPGPNGESSASTEAGPPGPGPAGDGAGDKAAAGLAGKQGGGAAPSVTAGGTGEPAAEPGPDTAQEGEAPGETGGSGRSDAAGSEVGESQDGGEAVAAAPGLLRPPEVSEICKPESVTEGQETTLSCRVTGHFPGVLSVSWHRKDTGAGAAVRLFNSPVCRIEPGAPHTQDGKSFQQETRLSFTPSARRDQGAEFVCRVGHVALQTPVERGSGELHVAGRSDAAGPEVGESQDGGEAVAAAPGTGAPGPNGESSASTEAGPPGPGPAGDGAGDKAAAGLAGKQGGGAAPSVTAGGTGEPAAETEPDTAQERDTPRETGGSARPQVSGIQVLPRRKPRDQGPFAVQIQNRPDLRVQVSIQQTSRDPPIKREIRARDTGLLRPPEVSEICKPESVTEGQETTLSCRMTGHFPGTLSVSWLRRGRGAGAFDRLFNSPKCRIESGAPHTQDGKSFQQETKLSFTPSVQRDHGAEYVCRVGHVALQMPVERGSGKLQVAAPRQ